MINKASISKIYKQKYLYLMLMPGLILITIFAYAPLSGWIMAFKKYELGLSIWKGEWTGLQQFKDFFSDTGSALYVLRNTISINLLTIFINLVGACIFAILLNEIRYKTFKRLFQTFSLFPFFISWGITYVIFYTFLSSTSGVINNFLVDKNMIKEGINFLGDANYAWPLILAVNAWKHLGYNAVIFLAAISNIDTEQYESAEIDGASRFQKICYITVPGLASTFVMLIIMNAGWIFSSNFEQFYLFTNPTNWKMMEVFDIYIYRYGLKLLNFSYATAVGILKTLASIIMLLLVNRISKKMSGRSLL